MKKFFVFLLIVTAGISAAMAQDGCETVALNFEGNATIRFVRYPHKVTTGVFTVGIDANTGDPIRIMFAPGNLQYKALSNTWRFALNQYDTWVNDAISGNTTAVAGRATQNQWIDLFGFGTSGAENVGGLSYTAYQPYATSSADAGDYISGSPTSLTGEYADADWAYYNPIINGGGKTGPASHQWRTMSSAEWNYLINSRNSNLYAYGSIMDEQSGDIVSGMFLLPDTWDWDLLSADTAAVHFAWEGGYVTDFTKNNVSSGTETDSLWLHMEKQGAIFLPAAGRRKNTGVRESDKGKGYYWTVDCKQGSPNAYCLLFAPGTVDCESACTRFFGCSIRPVQEIETE